MTLLPQNKLPQLLRSLKRECTPEIYLKYKLLLCDILGLSPSQLLLSEQSLSDAELQIFVAKAGQIANGMPLQYVTNVAYFYGLPFYVDQRVLIPRPETEQVVEYALRELCTKARVLDIGCGSGAICISLKKNRPDTHVWATDISIDALEVAQANALNLSCEIGFIQADLFPAIAMTFDLIVSNPPYISASEYQLLPAEVRDFEPALALLADDGGLCFYKRILIMACQYLVEGGRLLFEIGETQAEAIITFALGHGYQLRERLCDLAGRERILCFAKT